MNKRVDAKTQVYYSWDGHYNDGLGIFLKKKSFNNKKSLIAKFIL